jgi:hypothetical protein
MNAQSVALEAATIRQQCKVLRMPTIAAQCTQLAEQAVRERRTHLGYLEALLQGRTRGTRATADRTAHPRSPSAADQDAGGVRLRAQSQGLGPADS